ncbi:MAG: hypothetical protein H6811_03350 [Phycisphaeraceae bacterium]|nr:hypothetical protein [Phycisphaeraceae bacterium]
MIGLAAAAWISGAEHASAQFLDLGGAPPAPTLGDRTRTGELIETIESGIDRLKLRAGDRPGINAAIAWRVVAMALLSAEGEDASERILIGLTMAENFGPFDALVLGSSAPVNASQALMLARDLSSGDLPADLAELDRLLRDALAEVAGVPADAPQAYGWIDATPRKDPPPALDALLERWQSAGVLDTGAAERLAPVASTLALTQSWRVYAPAGRRLIDDIADAARVLSIGEDALEAPMRSALIAEFADAAPGVLEPELRDACLQHLAQLGQIADVVDLSMRIEERDARIAVRDAVGAVIAQSQSQRPDRVRLGGAVRALRLALARAELPDETMIVRQLRPAWRALLVRARESEQALLRVVDQTLLAPDAMTDPAVVGAIAVHGQAIDDLLGMYALHAVLVDPQRSGRDPPVREDRRMLAERSLRLGQSLARADEADSARVEVRLFRTQVEAFMELPGEGALRAMTTDPATAPVLESTTDGLAVRLFDDIDATRSAWLGAWAENSTSARDEAAARLASLSRLTAMLADAVVPLAEVRGVPSTLNAWPGWEVSRAALSILVQGLEGQLAQTTRLMLEGDASRATERLTTIEREHAAVRLLSRLERESSARGLSPRSDAPIDLILELGAGTPDPRVSWMFESRHQLAEICRYAAELPVARYRNLPQLEREIRRYVNDVAERVLERIGPERRTAESA